MQAPATVVAIVLTASSLLFGSGCLAADEAGPQPVAAAPAARTLTPEQAAITQRMLDFMAASEKDIFGRIARLNGTGDTESKDFHFDNADHLVKVARGKVVEKAGWYVNISTKATPPFVPEPLWNRYMEINIHPKTPHVGMLHATVYLAYFASGKTAMAGYMDYVPAVWHEEDNARLKSAVEAVYAKHGVDITRFRRQLCESAFGAKNHRDRLKGACVGASLYDPPFLEVNEANFGLASEAFTTFVSTYFDILESRRNDRVTPADLKAQDGMRRRWLEDQLFADTMSIKVVPYEVWAMANQAPDVRF